MAGFRLKSAEAPRLVESVRAVAAGDGVLEPRVTRRLMTAFAAASPTWRPAALDQLTDRKDDMLACLGAVLSNQSDRAAALHLRGDGEDPRVTGTGQTGRLLAGAAAILAQELCLTRD